MFRNHNFKINLHAFGIWQRRRLSDERNDFSFSKIRQTRMLFFVGFDARNGNRKKLPTQLKEVTCADSIKPHRCAKSKFEPKTLRRISWRL